MENLAICLSVIKNHPRSAPMSVNFTDYFDVRIDVDARVGAEPGHGAHAVTKLDPFGNLAGAAYTADVLYAL